MNSSVLKKNSGKPKTRYTKFIGVLGFIALLISIFTYQTSLHAAGQAPQEGKAPVKSDLDAEMVPYDINYVHELLSSNRELFKQMLESRKKARFNSPSPAAIPAGTPLNRVSFVADITSTDITAFADTDNDFKPDATEKLTTDPDAANDFFSAFAASPKSGKFYAAASAGDGDNKGKTTVLIVNNDAAGTYKGTISGMFPPVPGTITNLAVINSPKGDIVLALNLFFSKGFLDATDADKISLTAYLPNAQGFADGSQMMNIPLPQMTTGGNPINITFGGLTVDNKGTAYVSVGSAANNALGGFILTIKDTNGDFVPDAVTQFVGSGAGDTNPVTATSLAVRPNPGSTGIQLFTYSINSIFRGGMTQIAMYTDADGDGKADGPVKTFFIPPAQFRDILNDQGDGTSSLFSTHMDFGDDQAFFTYITVTGNSITGAGLASSKETSPGSGMGGAATTLMTAPKTSNNNQSFYSFIVGVPNTKPAGDANPPTVTVTSPNGGETVMGGTQLAIAYTSKDDVGVVSHDINLSTDSGKTFPIVVASGLAGNVQSFNFPVPPSLSTTNARIQVVAKDAGGNAGMDASDADFTIVKATTGDVNPPMVTITSPKSGDTLNGGSMATISFSSKDDVAVTAQNILFAADGNNFSTTLISGLPGSATSFSFRVPTINSSTAAIRIDALDAAGNRGSATVSQLKVVTDTTPPTVTVTSPGSKDKKLTGGKPFNVTFTAMDNVGVASIDVQIALDGTNFMTLASGLPGTSTSAMVNIPNMKTKAVSVIRVVAKDAAGNMGSGNSTAFKIKPSK
jgi:hypothetical protein